MGNSESGIEVQNRTDIEINAVAVNTVGMKVSWIRTPVLFDWR